MKQNRKNVGGPRRKYISLSCCRYRTSEHPAHHAGCASVGTHTRTRGNLPRRSRLAPRMPPPGQFCLPGPHEIRVSGCRLCFESGRQHGQARYRERLVGPAGSKNLACVEAPCAEPGGPRSGQWRGAIWSALGRRGAVASDERTWEVRLRHVSSSVRTVAGRERGRLKSISVSAPPFQRSVRRAARLSRSTLTITSSIKVPNSSFLSRGVVVVAAHTAARSGPSAHKRECSSIESTRGRSCSRRASSALAVSSDVRLSSHSRSRPRATSRLSGSTAR